MIHFEIAACAFKSLADDVELRHLMNHFSLVRFSFKSTTEMSENLPE